MRGSHTWLALLAAVGLLANAPRLHAQSPRERLVDAGIDVSCVYEGRSPGVMDRRLLYGISLDSAAVLWLVELEAHRQSLARIREAFCGQVHPGEPVDMALLALGKPDRSVSVETATGTSENWNYASLTLTIDKERIVAIARSDSQ